MGRLCDMLLCYVRGDRAGACWMLAGMDGCDGEIGSQFGPRDGRDRRTNDRRATRQDVDAATGRQGDRATIRIRERARHILQN